MNGNDFRLAETGLRQLKRVADLLEKIEQHLRVLAGGDGSLTMTTEIVPELESVFDELEEATS